MANPSVQPVSAPPPSVAEEALAPSTPLEGQTKGKRRQRFLSSVQRISSSPSLAQLGGRSRAPNPLYGTKGSLSCVSLSGASPFAQYNPEAASSGYFASTAPDSPTVEFPALEGIEARLAIRKIDQGAQACSTPGSIALPAEFITTRSRSGTTRKPPLDFLSSIPNEIRIHILSYLEPRELIRISRVSRAFHKYCYDGQLWTRLDATDFYRDIPAASLAKIVVAAGPFIKDLNLRGCVQVEHYKRAEAVVKACRNLINATLEGCRNFQKSTLHRLLMANDRLANLNLTGLPAVTNATCKVIAQWCPELETFNVSWCQQMDARGIRSVIKGCHKLREVRAGEIKGFNNTDVAAAIFKTNRLERLVLSGCVELSDESLRIMMHGVNPQIDILTDRPIVPPRKLRHLDLSRCRNLTNRGVEALGHVTPNLEGLQLNGCSALGDSSLEPILASTPRLTHLELEDLSQLTNDLFSKHLAKAPCAPKLEHLSISYCENIGDTGMIPVIKNCTGLKNVEMDNSRIGDLVLAEAAAMVRSRAARTSTSHIRPRIGLRIVVYDCQLVTWTGVREVLSWNAEIRQPSGSTRTYPTEIVGLKCFYGWQQTVEQHTQRVLRGEFDSASRLERKWAHYMQAIEEAGAAGAGVRRRRRRAREAQLLHADEEEGGISAGRRRARTVTSSCAIM